MQKREAYLESVIEGYKSVVKSYEWLADTYEKRTNDIVSAEFSKLSTIENDTIWYIDDDNDIRMTLEDRIKALREGKA